MSIRNFKVELGLDANDNRVVNVDTPIEKTDAVNLGYYEYYNSIVVYDSQRGYPEGFIVRHNDKLYIAKEEIKEPAGPFRLEQWDAVASPDEWKFVDARLNPVVDIKHGEFLAVSTRRGEIRINLPRDNFEGQTVSIFDVGNYTGYNKLEVVSSKVDLNVRSNKDMVKSFLITKPYSIVNLTFINGIWEVRQNLSYNKSNIDIDITEKSYKAQAGQFIRNYNDGGDLDLVLPKYANHGDVIEYTCAITTNTFINVKFDGDTNDKAGGRSDLRLPTYSDLRFIYNSTFRNWVINRTIKSRNETIVEGDEYTMSLNENVYLCNHTTNSNLVKIKLPKDSIEDEVCYINFTDLNYKKEVDIHGNDIKINYNKSVFGLNPSSVTLSSNINTVDNIKFNPYELGIASLKFSRNGDVWIISDITYRVALADAKTPHIPGVLPLADNKEMQSDVMSSDNTAVTPLELQKRQALESRKGIASLATIQETKDGKDDFKIITPKKLEARQSTYTLKGLSRYSTLDDLNAKHEDSVITPKILSDKFDETKLTTKHYSLTSTGNIWDGLTLNIDEASYKGHGVTKFFDPRDVSKLGDTKTGLSNIKVDDSKNESISRNVINDILNLYLPKEATSVNSDKLENHSLNQVLSTNEDLFKTKPKLGDENTYNKFKVFDGNSNDFKEAMDWLNPPPLNYIDYEVKDNIVEYKTGDEEPDYSTDYYYYRFGTKKTSLEFLIIDGIKYTRHTKLVDGKEVVRGWDCEYSILNKPTPQEINAVDKDELLIGKVQVDKYLDIIVDENNRLRIYPDDEERKVGFAWIEGEVDDHS